jgi:hypothetical protein
MIPYLEVILAASTFVNQGIQVPPILGDPDRQTPISRSVGALAVGIGKILNGASGSAKGADDGGAYHYEHCSIIYLSIDGFKPTLERIAKALSMKTPPFPFIGKDGKEEPQRDFNYSDFIQQVSAGYGSAGLDLSFMGWSPNMIGANQYKGPEFIDILVMKRDQTIFVKLVQCPQDTACTVTIHAANRNDQGIGKVLLSSRLPG